MTVYLVLMSSVVAGVLTVLGFKLDAPRKVKLITAFTGAYLMALVCLHFLPQTFGQHSHDATGASAHGAANGLMMGALVLLGFFLQVVLDNFTLGLEHGHAHCTHDKPPVAMLVGLCLHSFIEAIPLGNGELDRSNTLLLSGIAVHNYPISIVLLSMLLQSGVTRPRALALLALFTVTAPLGVLAGRIPEISQYSAHLMAVVIGIFMHVSTTILFETGEDHHYNRQKGIAIALGIAIAVLSVMLPGHTH
ncbi:MAG: hypothetical protein EXS22_05880 [Pedosphaera sp.]|nr:hypothetical protein [Pedosphaera sp.]MSU43549.1 hypothetical protein [Pedosphaera sp.]